MMTALRIGSIGMERADAQSSPRRHQVLAACLVGAGGPVHARTWQVPADAPTIAAAIDSASSGDVVAISNGTYLENGLTPESGLTICAKDPLGEVIIDAEGADRIFSCDSLNNVIVTGLTWTNGYL